MVLSPDWSIVNIKSGFRPLLFHRGVLLCVSGQKIYKCSLDLKKTALLSRLPRTQLLFGFFSSIRILNRIFRLDPTHAIAFDDEVYICRKQEIWKMSWTTGSISLDFVIPDGRRSLSISLVNSRKYGKSIVFGEYFSNPNMDPVRIWVKNLSAGTWFSPICFKKSSINHVHRVQSHGNELLVLCGDFRHAASMWLMDNSFQQLTPALTGKQAYRCCWLAGFPGNYFYATDSQIDDNYFCRLLVDDSKLSVQPLEKTNGSSIYYCESGTEFYFSTTIEGREPTGIFIFDLLDCRSGLGISTDRAGVYVVSPSHPKPKFVFSGKKDFWPFRLCQFGTFTFPSGNIPYSYLITYAIGLTGFDGKCIILKNNLSRKG